MTINHIYRGSLTLNNTTASTVGTIPAVVMTKTVFAKTGSTGSTEGPAMRVELTSSTDITALHNSGIGSGTVGYEVIEYI